MKEVMLDTSAYSASLRKHPGVVEALTLAEAIYFSPVVLGELFSGFRRGNRREKNRAVLREYLASPRTRIAPVDLETAERYAIIQEALQDAGTPIPTNAVWIAASAMQHGLTLLTTDAHFLKVKQVLTEHFDVRSA